MSQVKTILYVEDDFIVLTAHQKRLQQAGYHVITARDGLEAMKRLSIFVPDLVLLDLMLPRFNGEEVLQHIRSNPALVKVPVIVLSTNSILDSEQEYLLESASRRLIKSQCTAGILLSAVEEVLSAAAPEKKIKPRPEQIPVSFSPVLRAATA